MLSPADAGIANKPSNRLAITLKLSFIGKSPIILFIESNHLLGDGRQVGAIKVTSE
jgi:hypothetical protein